jgi:hypothetical protein
MLEENMKNKICSLEWKNGEWTISNCNGATLYLIKWEDKKWEDKKWEDKKWTVYKCNKEKICSMKSEDKKWIFSDSNDSKLKRMPNELLNNIYANYQNNRKNMREGDLACVWVLEGSETPNLMESKTPNLIQVGSNINLDEMWKNDIRKDIIKFFFESGNYSKLREECQKQETYKLTFYEVNIQKYLEVDTVINQILGKRPEDPSLLKAYAYVEAAYVEGKLGSYSKKHNNQCILSSIYNPSTLDGYFYDYFKKKKK